MAAILIISAGVFGCGERKEVTPAYKVPEYIVPEVAADQNLINFLKPSVKAYLSTTHWCSTAEQPPGLARCFYSVLQENGEVSSLRATYCSTKPKEGCGLPAPKNKETPTNIFHGTSAAIFQSSKEKT